MSRRLRRPPRNSPLREPWDLYHELRKMLWAQRNAPETPESLYWLHKLEESIDGATAYWRRVEAAMEEAAVELRVIEKGGRDGGKN
jgi:hypothetical protein